MPFVSQAQRRKCYAIRAKNPNSSWDCEEFEAHTPKDTPLPERVAKLAVLGNNGLGMTAGMNLPALNGTGPAQNTFLRPKPALIPPAAQGAGGAAGGPAGAPGQPLSAAGPSGPAKLARVGRPRSPHAPIPRAARPPAGRGEKRGGQPVPAFFADVACAPPAFFRAASVAERLGKEAGLLPGKATLAAGAMGLRRLLGYADDAVAAAPRAAAPAATQVGRPPVTSVLPKPVNVPGHPYDAPVPKPVRPMPSTEPVLSGPPTRATTPAGAMPSTAPVTTRTVPGRGAATPPAPTPKPPTPAPTPAPVPTPTPAPPAATPGWFARNVTPLLAQTEDAGQAAARLGISTGRERLARGIEAVPGLGLTAVTDAAGSVARRLGFQAAGNTISGLGNAATAGFRYGTGAQGVANLAAQAVRGGKSVGPAGLAVPLAVGSAADATRLPGNVARYTGWNPLGVEAPGGALDAQGNPAEPGLGTLVNDYQASVAGSLPAQALQAAGPRLLAGAQDAAGAALQGGPGNMSVDPTRDPGRLNPELPGEAQALQAQAAMTEAANRVAVMTQAGTTPEEALQAKQELDQARQAYTDAVKQLPAARQVKLRLANASPADVAKAQEAMPGLAQRAAQDEYAVKTDPALQAEFQARQKDPNAPLSPRAQEILRTRQELGDHAAVVGLKKIDSFLGGGKTPEEIKAWMGDKNLADPAKAPVLQAIRQDLAAAGQPADERSVVERFMNMDWAGVLGVVVGGGLLLGGLLSGSLAMGVGGLLAAVAGLAVDSKFNLGGLLGLSSGPQAPAAGSLPGSATAEHLAGDPAFQAIQAGDVSKVPPEQLQTTMIRMDPQLLAQAVQKNPALAPLAAQAARSRDQLARYHAMNRPPAPNAQPPARGQQNQGQPALPAPLARLKQEARKAGLPTEPAQMAAWAQKYRGNPAGLQAELAKLSPESRAALKAAIEAQVKQRSGGWVTDPTSGLVARSGPEGQAASEVYKALSAMP